MLIILPRIHHELRLVKVETKENYVDGLSMMKMKNIMDGENRYLMVMKFVQMVPSTFCNNIQQQQQQQ